MKKIVDKLRKMGTLTREEWIELIQNRSPELAEYVFEQARSVRKKHYGNRVYIRGLIEFTNFCKNDCYYCGIRRSNFNASRYRLDKAEILGCCKRGYELGFRTFVLQGGEDAYFSDERIVEIVSEIKQRYPDCAITLSIGEKDFESYKKFFEAGHEIANHSDTHKPIVQNIMGNYIRKNCHQSIDNNVCCICVKLDIR